MTVALAGAPILASDLAKLETLSDQRTTDAGAITTTTLVSVLSVTLPRVGTYRFNALVLATNTGAAGRPGFALGGTSTATAWRWACSQVQFNNAACSGGNGANGAGYPGSTSGSVLINVDWSTTTGYTAITITGTVTVSVAGTLDFRFSEAAGAGTLNVKAASMVSVNLVT